MNNKSKSWGILIKCWEMEQTVIEVRQSQDSTWLHGNLCCLLKPTLMMSHTKKANKKKTNKQVNNLWRQHDSNLPVINQCQWCIDAVSQEQVQDYIIC